jgi:hypothetical protein
MNGLGKIIGIKIGVALTLTFCGPNSQAQVLVNPSFANASEFFGGPPILFPPNFSGFPGVNQGWALNGFVGPADLGGGYYGVLEQATPSTGWNASGGEAYQIDSGVTSGIKYEFDISCLTTTGFSGLIYPNVALNIGFLDSSLNDIGTVENPPSPYPSLWFPIPSENTWYRGSISGTAPVGASYVIVSFSFADVGNATLENVYFTGASLSIVPEPCGFALISLGLAVPILCRCLRVLRPDGHGWMG